MVATTSCFPFPSVTHGRNDRSALLCDRSDYHMRDFVCPVRWPWQQGRAHFRATVTITISVIGLSHFVRVTAADTMSTNVFAQCDSFTSETMFALELLIRKDRNTTVCAGEGSRNRDKQGLQCNSTSFFLRDRDRSKTTKRCGAIIRYISP